MEKLLENLDKMVWRNINKLSDEELNETEKGLKIKFPKEDRKYLKAYNRGEAQNIYLKIKNSDFLIHIRSFEFKNLIRGIEIFFKDTEEVFNERNLIPIIWKIEFKREDDILKGTINNLIMYDYTKNVNSPQIIYVKYFMKLKDNLKTVRYEYDLEKESIQEIEICNNLRDIFEYMYIDNKEIEMEKISWRFEETATVSEIEEFQNETGLKFPEKYERLLNRAREEGVEIYPERFKKEVPENVVDTGVYMNLEEIKSSYEAYVNYHKPYPKKLIPIKECGGGDKICLDYRGKLNTTLKEPKITYYVHDEIGNRRFIHLADSYDDFLDMIEIDKEEIAEREKEIKESYFYGEQPLED